MSKKELRINEIMSQQKVDEDVAELLFQDELSKMFHERFFLCGERFVKAMERRLE